MASIKKRGKTWYVRFSKRVTEWDPEKKSTVSVLKQKSKGGFKTKAEAQQYGIKMEAASLSGIEDHLHTRGEYNVMQCNKP